MSRLPDICWPSDVCWRVHRLKEEVEQLHKIQGELEELLQATESDRNAAHREIERLRKELSECQATAGEIHRQMCMQWGVMTLANQNARRWPWLEEAATKAAEGEDE